LRWLSAGFDALRDALQCESGNARTALYGFVPNHGMDRAKQETPGRLSHQCSARAAKVLAILQGNVLNHTTRGVTPCNEEVF
jgi:hypothetical protein